MMSLFSPSSFWYRSEPSAASPGSPPASPLHSGLRHSNRKYLAALKQTKPFYCDMTLWIYLFFFHLYYVPTDLGVTTAVGGATTSGVSGSSSSVWEVHSMSLALLLPDTPVSGSAAASPTSAPEAVELSGDAGSASSSVFAGISPGCERAELEWERQLLLKKAQLQFFLPLKPPLGLNCIGKSYLYMDSPSGRLVSKQSGRMMM